MTLSFFSIPFLTSHKVCPAVVMGRSSHVGDLFVVPISSQMQNVNIPLQDWRAADLNAPCGIKSQIATIEERLVLKRVGSLPSGDQTSLATRVRLWLQL